jgi:hypothetical protein
MSGQLPSCARGLLSRWHTNTLCAPQALVQRSGSAARLHKAPPPHAARSHKACSVPQTLWTSRWAHACCRGMRTSLGMHHHLTAERSSLELVRWRPRIQERLHGGKVCRERCGGVRVGRRVQSFGFWGMQIFSSSHTRARTVAATHMPMCVIFVECSGGRLVRIARPPRKGGPSRSACDTHTHFDSLEAARKVRLNVLRNACMCPQTAQADECSLTATPSSVSTASRAGVLGHSSDVLASSRDMMLGGAAVVTLAPIPTQFGGRGLVGFSKFERERGKL